ncbi:hypothetical protein N9385_02140 [Candidatus Nitrosopelagicus sp.]|nr:hypothetical protein [Candidatus Nitrosopelagicus sp.]|tara:strand:- start:141 stop:521 length:381 start_codon:yes stop_codon:yes gene_type:complete
MLFDSNNRKYSYFLIAVIGCIVILSIPMMYGHFFHEGHMFFVAIHESGFILATFLTVMAIISYKKTKVKRMLFSAAAFGVLAFGQGEVMYQKMHDHTVDLTSPGNVLEYCIVIMTVLFAIGIFYKR